MAELDAIDAPQLQPAEQDRTLLSDSVLNDPNLEEPKKVMCSFLIFVGEIRKSTTEELGSNATRAAVFTRMSQKWKELPESEKDIYNQKHAVAKSDYEAAMDEFKAAGGVAGERKAKNKAILQQRRLKSAKRKGNKDSNEPDKDSNEPKQPSGGAYGGYMEYMDEHRPEIQRQLLRDKCDTTKQLPTGSFDTAVNNVGSGRWRALPRFAKAKYINLFDANKSKFEEEEAVCDSGSDDAEDEKSLEVGGEKPLKVRKIEPSGNIADADLLHEAKKCGLNLKLALLADRPEVKKLGVTMRQIFDVLKASDGKVVVAKKKLVLGSAGDEEIKDDHEIGQDELEEPHVKQQETPD